MEDDRPSRHVRRLWLISVVRLLLSAQARYVIIARDLDAQSARTEIHDGRSPVERPVVDLRPTGGGCVHVSLVLLPRAYCEQSTCLSGRICTIP